MKDNLEAILYSQHLDLDHPQWKLNGCGIVSLFMLMDYWKCMNVFSVELPEMNDLYGKGLESDAYLDGVGWKHAGLVELAKSYGFKHSKMYDLPAQKIKDVKAFKILEKQLEQGPVMVSVYSKYEPGNRGHLAILSELTVEQATLYDPDATTRQEVRRVIPRNVFDRAWKKRFIVVRP